MGKSCKCSYQKVQKVCFNLGLYAKTYTVGATTDGAGTAATLGAIIVFATANASAGGSAVLTPLVPQTTYYTGLNLVGGRFNNGVNQTALGFAGITAQLFNGTPRLVIPSYGTTTAASIVNWSLINLGLSTGTAGTNTFPAGATVTLYFAKV